MKKWFYRVCVALAATIVLLVLGTIVPRPLWPTARAEDQAVRRIVLLSNPIHTDIAIPLDDRVLQTFAPLLKSGIRADLPDARYLVFGWGSKAFYVETPTWSALKPGPLLAALTVDSSVMHVDVVADIDLAQPFAEAVEIGDVELQRLEDFILASFRFGPDGPIRLPESAYGDFDAFFEANGYFNAFVGCNTWTARALREAGLRTGWWNPIPQSLGLSLALHN